MVYSLLSAKSCSHLKRLSPETVSGTYLIDPDGKGNLAPFIVTCDMTDKTGVGQPRPQGLLLDDVQNGGSSGEDPGKG